MPDKLETIGRSKIQHGSENDRIYLMHLAAADMPDIPEQLNNLAAKNRYGKIFAKVPEPFAEVFQNHGYRVEAKIPNFFDGETTAAFLAKYFKAERQLEPEYDLVKQLSYMNVQPYYVYQHDMVQGVEELRTRIGDTVEIERHVRGATAGFNTPTFVTDVPGGGGKRDVHSYDYYDEVTGVSVYRSPSVDEEKVYLYFDPIDLLPAEGQARWADPQEQDVMIDEAIRAAGLTDLERAVE